MKIEIDEKDIILLKAIREVLENTGYGETYGYLGRIEAIVLSMTPKERRNPSIIKASRKERIAKGSGTSIQDVNKLLTQFEEMRKMMKAMSSGKMKLPF